MTRDDGATTRPARLPETFACATCARPFGDRRDDARDDARDDDAKIGRVARRFASSGGPVCRACYQRTYRARAREARRCAACGVAGDVRWRARVDEGGEKRWVCRTCDVNAAWRASEGGDGRGDAVDAREGRCARCGKSGPGSSKTFWYRGESGAMRGERVCKQCHLLDYRARLNADPSVYCSGCGKTELLARHWRKRAGGGHWCDACYKRDRLERMNDDPGVFCVSCASTTSGPPEWRRKGDGYLCRSCLSQERNVERRKRRDEELVRVGSLTAPE